MGHAAGSALYAHFIHAGGTVVLTGDQRSMSWDDTQSFADTTAGSDAATSQVTTTYSVTGSFDFLDNGESEAYASIMFPGASGTLVWGPQGTATGKPKYELPIDWEGMSNSAEYSSEITKSATWRNNGAWVSNYARSGDTW